MFRAFILVAPILAVAINHDNDNGKLWNWLKDEAGNDPIDAVLKAGSDAPAEPAPSSEAASPAAASTDPAPAKDSSYTDILTSGASAPAAAEEPAQAEVYHPPAAEMNFGSSSSGSSRLITIPLDSQFIQGGRHLRGA